MASRPVCQECRSVQSLGPHKRCTEYAQPMIPSSSSADPVWESATAAVIGDVFASASVRWWLSGGVALDHWLHREIRARANTDVSVLAADMGSLVDSLAAGYTAWAAFEDGSAIPFGEVRDPLALEKILIKNESQGRWTAQVHAEDGSSSRWQYRRDGRLQLPWERAVLDIDGIPTGAPEVQLVWKALRPRPEDDRDKEAVLPELSENERAWFERAILSIHPHSSWSIHVRSPFAPAKASWNRTKS